jgi:hypothetical protein
MQRSEVILAILSSANGATLSPAQLQKAAFLISRNAPELFDDGQSFNFVPYDYGPFDKAVYDDAGSLAVRGLASVSPSPWGRWNVYAATGEGIEAGQAVRAQMPANLKAYVEEVTDWVRKQSFASLVKSIYQQYPEMRANSIFQG